MVSLKEEKRNPNDISPRRRHMEGRKRRRIRPRILQHEVVSQTYLLQTLDVIPRGRPLSRGQAKRRTGPNRIPLPNQEERSRRLRRRERKGRKEEEKKEEKKRSPKEGLIILPKNGHSLSNLTEDIEMNGVRLVREGEKCLYCD